MGAYEWATALAVIVGLTLTWAVLGPVVDDILVQIQTNYERAGIRYPDWVKEIVGALHTVFEYFPVIMVIGVFIWALVRSMRREPYEYSWG